MTYEYEKDLWKSDIFIRAPGKLTSTLLKTSLSYCCFSILPVQTN